MANNIQNAEKVSCSLWSMQCTLTEKEMILAKRNRLGTYQNADWVNNEIIGSKEAKIM